MNLRQARQALLSESAPAVNEKDAGWFAAEPPQAKDVVSFLPQTLDSKNRTVDVVWYGGQTVPRYDRKTGEDFMLRLDMQGCRMDRLNAGAAVCDSHMTGQDFASYMADMSGTRAQLGRVTKAWAEGTKGMATLKFWTPDEDDDSDEADHVNQVWSKIEQGIINNLSFGTWIYTKEPEDAAAGATSNKFVATDWEPFEISPVTVPADFSTQFLGAQAPSDVSSTIRATSPSKENSVNETTQGTGAEARTDQAVLDAARAQQLRSEGAKEERLRVAAIRSMGTSMAKHGIAEAFITKLIDEELSVEDARTRIFEELATKSGQTATGQTQGITSEVAVTRDGGETRLACMQSAILLRSDPQFYLNAKDANGVKLYDQGQQKRFGEMGREYLGFSLIEMARESVELTGRSTRGMSRNQIATAAMLSKQGAVEYFEGGAESTSDFPNILANVANKTLRQAYQALPQTYKPFCRQVTAPDFKPINRMQLNDLPALNKLNERGEYHRSILTDSGINYTLATYGDVVAITRRAIINDDLQAFTRVSMALGQAAAQMQSNTVWGIITANTQVMQDGQVLFAGVAGNRTQANLLTGASSAITYNTTTDPVAALGAARAAMRAMKGPGGTYLNLIPQYLMTGTKNETFALKMLAPIDIASSNAINVVPQWIRTLVPIIEPRLDATNNPWYLAADPSQIDTIEYCFLEGQEGVYFETRLGFDVDGLEMKARVDFAAAAIEHRGLQKNAGA